MKHNEKVISMDMTFCERKKCKYKQCDRHQCHMIKPYPFPVSMADFYKTEECEVRGEVHNG